MSKLIKASEIKLLIVQVRGKNVILDADLAKIYCVSTKRLNEQVIRNIDRFPEDFMFLLTDEEKDEVVANCDHLSKLKFSSYLPRAFTHNGANMLSAVLRSHEAVQRSIQIMRAFTAIEQIMAQKKQVAPDSPTVMDKLSTHSRAIMHLFQKDKVKAHEIAKVKKIINEMIGVLQQMALK